MPPDTIRGVIGAFLGLLGVALGVCYGLSALRSVGFPAGTEGAGPVGSFATSVGARSAASRLPLRLLGHILYVLAFWYFAGMLSLGALSLLADSVLPLGVLSAPAVVWLVLLGLLCLVPLGLRIRLVHLTSVGRSSLLVALEIAVIVVIPTLLAGGWVLYLFLTDF